MVVMSVITVLGVITVMDIAITVMDIIFIAYHRNADVAITVLMDPITVMVVIHAPVRYKKPHDSHLVFTLITP